VVIMVIRRIEMERTDVFDANDTYPLFDKKSDIIFTKSYVVIHGWYEFSDE